MLKHKKFLTAMMIFIVATLVASGCSESDKSVAPVSNTYHEFTDDNGKTHSYDTADPEFIAAKAQSEALDMWVERMDPFVTETKDGTYDFDHTSFQAEYGELDDASKTTVKQLKDGIPVVNQKILDKGRTGAPSAAGSWCNWYWWGRRCCYTGTTARQYILALTFGATIPPLSYGFAPAAGWAGYLTDVYGGFCVSNSWVGGIWFSAP